MTKTELKGQLEEITRRMQEHKWRRIGSLVAIAAFVVGLLARGPGRIPAIVQGTYSLAVWLPFFWVRVLLHHAAGELPIA